LSRVSEKSDSRTDLIGIGPVKEIK
jgi:hypothetical protein